MLRGEVSWAGVEAGAGIGRLGMWVAIGGQWEVGEGRGGRMMSEV